jgi:hypothetical protein
MSSGSGIDVFAYMRRPRCRVVDVPLVEELLRQLAERDA